MSYLNKIKIKGKCINTNDKINNFLNHDNNIVIGMSDSVYCFERSSFYDMSKRITDRGITYTYTKSGGYICPRDLGSIKNDQYCIYYFEPLRMVNNKYQIYNVKSYTLNEYNSL